MTSIKNDLKNLIAENNRHTDTFQRNLLKEHLQILVLDFIYSHPKYSELIFYGGSCLAHCFDLPRLSEDLDFVDLRNKIKLAKLAKDLENYFNQSTDLPIKITAQKFRLYLKFPILKELDLAKGNDSDFLFLKVEIFQKFNFCAKYQTEIIPLFKADKSILIKTFDLPTLMATKIRAILNRVWEKTDKAGRTIAVVKGRDYFDLMWYLEKKIKPNFDCLEIKNLAELKAKLLKKVNMLDEKSIQYDLEALIDNIDFVKKLSRNIKDILKKEIQKYK